jgi:cyclopropane fatty-acyl-phospholipid synthase-like methyltransferase
VSDRETPAPSPAEVVARGYDLIGERYLDWSSGELSPGRRHALAEIAAHLAPGSRILDLGCGAGIPMTAALARDHDVLGVDISPKQIERARRNVPAATFESADAMALALSPASFDAVVAFFSLTHLERDLLPTLLGRIESWLRRPGILVASFGTRDSPGSVEADWLGAPMYFSGFDSRTNTELVVNAGFTVLRAIEVDEHEDTGTARFLWITAAAAGGVGGGGE